MAVCVHLARSVRKMKGLHRFAPRSCWKEGREEMWTALISPSLRNAARAKSRFSFFFFFFLLFVAAITAIPPYDDGYELPLFPILVSAMADWCRCVAASQPRYPFLSSTYRTTSLQRNATQRNDPFQAITPSPSPPPIHIQPHDSITFSTQIVPARCFPFFFFYSFLSSSSLLSVFPSFLHSTSAYLLFSRV
jgi:hypothetical protein